MYLHKAGQTSLLAWHWNNSSNLCTALSHLTEITQSMQKPSVIVDTYGDVRAMFIWLIRLLLEKYTSVLLVQM